MQAVPLPFTSLVGRYNAEIERMMSLWHAWVRMQMARGVRQACSETEHVRDWQGVPGVPGRLPVHGYQQRPQGGAGWEGCAAW